ncbi:MAG: ASKHA domain-containing protein [Methanomicrobiales archaeon]|nr:ASKHA domain-containing protein [Methanomicrobiales archaeon]
MLIDSLREAGIDVESICGGKGLCRKCRVIVSRGRITPVSADYQKRFTGEEIAEGYVLACRVQVHEDCEITIPVESRIDTPQILLALHPPETEVQPAVRTYAVQHIRSYLPFETGSVTLSGYQGPRPRMSEELYRQIAGENDLVARVSVTGDVPEVIAVEKGEERSPPYGLAVDLGTTTIVCLLVDLESGDIVAADSDMNRQITYGEEVITRIAYAAQSGGRERLAGVAIDSINTILGRLEEQSGIPSTGIMDLCVGGNTVMDYLLVGIDPTPLELAHAPVSRAPLLARAGTLGLHTNPNAGVYCLPNVSRFLGGDAVGDVITAGMHRKKDISLLIDLGTNGEIVLGNEDWLASTSCASGPAFEGGGILHGMRAMRGAIDHVEIDPKSGTRNFTVIGHVLPRGICGSGILDLVCALFRNGILDFTGRLVPGSAGVREGRRGPEFLIVPGAGTQTGKDIVLTQEDMAYIMDSKAAVCSAVSVLMKKYRICLGDVRQVYLAGAFGTYVDPAVLMKFGIIPAFSSAEFHPIGNGSLSGAYAALISVKQRKAAEEVARKMVYIDLLTDLDFIEEYTAALYIPGKKELFPGQP